MPARAWTSGSHPGASRSGPVEPQALMEHVTNPARLRRISSSPSPSRASAPGRRFSTSRSA